MALRDDVEFLLETWKSKNGFLAHNEILFDIYEGQLLPYVLSDLKQQLSEKSFEQAKHRVPPINVLRRINDKLSKIYDNPPIRDIVGGSDADKKNLSELINSLDMNTEMGVANEFFNLFKNTFVEPYLNDEGMPRLRAVPSERFIVASRNRTQSTKPTHYMKCVGVDTSSGDSDTLLFHAFTDQEFLIFNSKGEIRLDLMAELNNVEGINRYGKLPGVYINRSRHNLIPKPDTDTLAMTKLIPVLLADCNFAVMYQSFSILFGIDVNDENLVRSPNAFWTFRTDPNNPDAKPQVGSIKPDVDTDKVISLIRAELSMWMETKNIKPGSMGDVTVENVASGVAKMIDEADTSADRQKQTTFFGPADAEILSLIINHMHPVWLEDQSYQFKERFSSNRLKITCRFPVQVPIHDPGRAIDMETKKLDKRLTTRKKAILAINPDMTDEQADELIIAIDAESIAKEPVSQDSEGKTLNVG